MTIEKYDNYELEIKSHNIPYENRWVKGYFYLIRKDNKVLHEANEYSETEQAALYAAIGHINLIEQGENQ